MDKKRFNFQITKYLIILYDLIVFIAVELVVFFLSILLPIGTYSVPFLYSPLIIESLVSFIYLAIFRFIFRVYSQIWRYGNTNSYIRLFVSDGFALLCSLITVLLLPSRDLFPLRIIVSNLLVLFICMFVRMIYRFIYKNGTKNNFFGKVFSFLIGFFGANQVNVKEKHSSSEVNVAIIGAGSSGMCLSEELANNETHSYSVKCFLDINPDKIGRHIAGIPVISWDSVEQLKNLHIDEIVLAIPTFSLQKSLEIFSYYKKYGYNMKIFDDSDSIKKVDGKKISLREFKIEDLLFRNSISTVDDKTSRYYSGKTILITGGGGSIGSELCRQIAKFSPKQIIIVDVYENGAYDVQQEIKNIYGNEVSLCVEIVSVCDKNALECVFEKYRPNIVIHAAAHKHVPLMEHNCCEAVKNNVFGTLNTVELSEKYGADRFMMVSTDKAVNPTNVMGATKRMCEMIVQCKSTQNSKTVFTATRFGNVLGSAGSVIPLFKRQIAAGGPITITDKRIIRYFMTIPEASQLVLTSGAMAKNGELFVLDMGKPVKIIDLAESMIRLSGFEPYKDIDIREIGLRPGEKLYEELLIKPDELDKTENSLIFIEREKAISTDTLNEKLRILKKAVDSQDDQVVKQSLFEVVPTYKTPETVNSEINKVKIMA